MLKKLAIYILILAGVGILFISTSETMMRKISEVRNESDAWWGVHNSNYKGDLVNMAYLDYVDKFHSERDYAFTRAAGTTTANVNLYINGDSYTFKIPDTAFAGVNRYEYAWVYNKHIQYSLDSAKKNILVLEHAERYVTTFYSGLDLLRLVYDSTSGSVYDSIVAMSAYAPPVPLTTSLSQSGRGLLDEFFNKNINQNIEYNLFNYNLLNALRLAKASLNYSLFNRASGDVVIADNGNQLFLNETIDTKNRMSAFYLLSDNEYRTIVSNLNFLYDYYRSEGFDEVYLAMIPNPVTILQPDGYNQLIPRLQNDPRLHIKCIDIYSVYQSTDTVIYRPGDSHWFNSGMQMWIRTVNDSLRKWNSET